MGNPAAQYEELIRALCSAAGISPWSEIAASQHLRVGEQLVGLIPDIDVEPPTLSIFIELGQTHPGSDSALHARMLEANLSKRADMPGHYGLHPETHQAVYTFTLPLDEMDGEELAACLDSQIGLCNEAMASMAQADR